MRLKYGVFSLDLIAETAATTFQFILRKYQLAQTLALLDAGCFQQLSIDMKVHANLYYTVNIAMRCLAVVNMKTDSLYIQRFRLKSLRISKKAVMSQGNRAMPQLFVAV